MKERMSHTPGPWTVTWDEFGGYDCMTPAFRVRDENDRAVVTLDCGRTADPVIEANARLIAAAPDLLVALRDLCDAIPDETITADPPLGCWVEAARAAIAKAEGR